MGESFTELTSLAARLNETRSAKNLMEAFPRTIEFDLKGEEGKFHLKIDAGKMSIVKGASKDADLAVAGDTLEFAKVARGKIDVTHPIAHGHLTVTKGKMSELTLLNRIIVARDKGAAK